jgi:CubicO group peptidase (beta-lactamase class C family)
MQGDVDARFAAVGDAFRRNFADHGERGAAVALVVDGTSAVDLWDGAADPDTGQPWTRDTLQVVYSATKGVVAACLAMLVDRNALDYDDAVADHWPEFAACGKESITVAQLLSHQAGLSALDEPITLADIADQSTLAARLARQCPLWSPASAHGYHAVTFGFFAGELVRRVTGRSLGAFIEQEIRQPLGLDLYVGTPSSVDARVGRTVQAGLDTALSDPARPIVQAMMDPSSLTSRSMFAVPELGMPGAMNGTAVRRLEVPSVNGVADARSLAHLYGALAGGHADQLFRAETVARATATAVDGDDVVLLERTAFALGFMKPATGFFAVSPDGASFGHPGNGGSTAFADPVAGIGFAYVTSTLMGAQSDRRVATLTEALYNCL